ncbi:MAG: hypothetical protein AAGJ74_14800, partial [Pseudomonadota bacterium]
HPGRLSWRDEDGDDHLFVGGEMLKMIYESVEGTRILSSDEPYDRSAAATTYAFEGDDKLIVFIAAGSDPNTEVTIEIDNLAADYTSVFADRLSVGENPNWMHDFAIVDNPHVDESPEAATYAPGVRTEADVELFQNAITTELGAHEVVRLAFAKTDAASTELEAVSEGSEILLQMADLPILSHPPASLPDDITQAAADDGFDDGSDGGGGGGVFGAFILPLLLLLF